MQYPLVLISGLLSNDSMWQHQVSHLHDLADIQVFNPTQDRSEKMVEAILKAAPPIFALAGHSMGGWLCLEILPKTAVMPLASALVITQIFHRHNPAAS